jgi:HprK-related kinase A
VKVCEIASEELHRSVRQSGIRIRTGPFVCHVQSSFPAVAEGIQQLYQDFTCDSNGFADFHLRLVRPRNVHYLWRPQVTCYLNGDSPFSPLPSDQAFAAFESLLNWSIYTTTYNYLIIHGATVERNGYAAILAAPPGSGKSTLCAALVSRGWRLLTDELTLVSPVSGLIAALARPISLKNNAIDVLREYAPQEVFGSKIHNTVKGTIAHMRPPAESVTRMHDAATPAWLIFPKFQAGAPTSTTALAEGQAFIRLSSGLVNYPVLGALGFEALTRLIDHTDAFNFTYSDLDEAMAWFNDLQPPSQTCAGSERQSDEV